MFRVRASVGNLLVNQSFKCNPDGAEFAIRPVMSLHHPRALLDALVFGDTSGLSLATYFLFQQTGLAHLACASGFHMGLVAGTVTLIQSLLWRCYFAPRLTFSLPVLLASIYTRPILTLVACTLYAHACDWRMPITRALLIVGLWQVTPLLIRRPNTPLLVAVSIGGALLLGTGTLLSILLSASAVISILWAMQLAGPCRAKWLVLPLAPWLATTPITTAVFHTFSIISPVANLVFVPVFSFGVILPGLFLRVAGLSEPAWFLHWIDRLLLVLEYIAFRDGVSWLVTPLPALFFATGLTVAFWRRNLLFAAAGLCLALFALDSQNFEVAFLNVGQGDAILLQQAKLQSGTKQTCLIDAGLAGKSPYHAPVATALAGLRQNQFNCLLLTHADRDHTGGIYSMLMRHRLAGPAIIHEHQLHYTKTFVYLAALEQYSVNIRMFHSNLKLNNLQCTSLNRNTQKINETSPFCTFRFRSGRRLLLTGDAGKVSERDYLKKPDIGRFHYLKLGHHGSRHSTSRELLDHTQPKVAIASVGRNWFGHPHISVLNRLWRRKIKILRTDRDGNIFLPE